MYQKLMLRMRNKFMYLNTNQLINYIISDNQFISTLAKEELLKRDLSNLNLKSDQINMIINKFTIEELWYLANLNLNNNFIKEVIIKLNKILDYYQKLNIEDFLKKKNEGKIKLHLMK